MTSAGDGRFPWLLASCGFLILFSFALISFIPNHMDALGLYLGLYGAAFLFYMAAVHIILHAPDTKESFTLILGVALLLRLVLLPVWPSISTDYYRYRWDGKVALNGINPYLYSPASPKLSQLRDDMWHWINYRSTGTPYPPTSQIIFKITYRIGHGSPIPIKLVYLFCDTLIVMMLLQLLRHFGLPQNRVMIYAWNPLLITETFSSAHQDIISASLLLAAVYLVVRSNRSFLSGVALSAASLVKFYTLPLIPLFLKPRRPLLFAAGFMLTALVLYLPFISAGPRIFSGLHDYASGWKITGPVAVLLDRGLAYITPNHSIAARIACAVSALCLILAYLKWEPVCHGLLGRTFAVSSGLLLLIPTLYPWYLVSIVPFLCFFPMLGWLLFTGTAVLYYLLGPNHFPSYVLAITYLPVLLALSVNAIRGFSCPVAKK